jgi:NTP pyrophosphatase (non-canonical NTP hydrolase)
MNIKKDINLAASKRTLQFTYLKVIEELFELGETCSKQLTKPVGSQDRLDHLVEEMGDVIINVKLLATKLNLTKQVKQRIIDKLQAILLV